MLTMFPNRLLQKIPLTIELDLVEYEYNGRVIVFALYGRCSNR